MPEIQTSIKVGFLKILVKEIHCIFCCCLFFLWNTISFLWFGLKILFSINHFDKSESTLFLFRQESDFSRCYSSILILKHSSRKVSNKKSDSYRKQWFSNYLRCNSNGSHKNLTLIERGSWMLLECGGAESARTF